MRVLVLAAFITNACVDEDIQETPEAILQDNASDEVFLTFLDAEAQGIIEIDDIQAAVLSAPSSGDMLSLDEISTFAWALPTHTAKHARHGVSTGQFVWLRILGEGMDEPVHVLSVESTEYTPDLDTWEKIMRAEDSITCALVTAYVDRGVIEDGPYRPSTDPTFAWTE